jgi:hypothetical protein
MAHTKIAVDEIRELAPGELTQLDEVAETIRVEALVSAQNKMGALQRGLDLPQLLARADFLDYFKYGLAVGMARVIAASDSRVHSIHLFQPSGSADAEASSFELDPTIHLLVAAQAASPALEAFLASLDRAMVSSLRQLPAPQFAEREWILDAKLLTEEMLAEGKGYACLFQSSYAPPLKVWERAE